MSNFRSLFLRLLEEDLGRFFSSHWLKSLVFLFWISPILLFNEEIEETIGDSCILSRSVFDLNIRGLLNKTEFVELRSDSCPIKNGLIGNRGEFYFS